MYVLVRPQGTNTQIFTKRSKKITKWVVNERYKRSNELKKKNAQIYISTKKNMFVKTHILLHNSITIGHKVVNVISPKFDLLILSSL